MTMIIIDNMMMRWSPLADWQRRDCVCVSQFLINPSLHDVDDDDDDNDDDDDGDDNDDDAYNAD